MDWTGANRHRIAGGISSGVVPFNLRDVEKQEIDSCFSTEFSGSFGQCQKSRLLCDADSLGFRLVLLCLIALTGLSFILQNE